MLKFWILTNIIFTFLFTLHFYHKHDMRIKQPHLYLLLNIITMQIDVYILRFYTLYKISRFLLEGGFLTLIETTRIIYSGPYPWHTPQIVAIAWFKVCLARVQIRSSGGHRIDNEISICGYKDLRGTLLESC